MTIEIQMQAFIKTVCGLNRQGPNTSNSNISKNSNIQGHDKNVIQKQAMVRAGSKTSTQKRQQSKVKIQESSTK